MTVKLALLKSGEQVISDIKELVDENQKIISLVFENPYIVQFLTAELLYEGVSANNMEVDHKVSFTPWLPLSLDKTVPVSSDWVVSIVEPIEWIKKSYEEKMNKTTEGSVNENLPISPENEEDYANIEIVSE
ncbi:MAG: hypothetical protein ACO3CD_04665 [Candidatus Nanopelagicaceae bacterium]